MADNTTWESDLEAALGESTDTEALDAPDTTSLDSDSSPSVSDQDAADETPLDQTEELTEEVEDSTETEQETAEPLAAETVVEPTKPNWDSDENPHYAKARQFEETQAKARMLVEQAARQRAIELQNQRIKALSDDDPQREVEIQQLVHSAQTPVLERAQQLEGEVEFAAKLATVVEAAVAHVLTPEDHQKVVAEVERMMALPGGPEYLQHDLATRSADRARYTAERSADQQKIAELERRLAAQSVLDERRKSGADVVDSNTGVGKSFQSRYDAASGEEALDVILEDILTR